MFVSSFTLPNGSTLQVAVIENVPLELREVDLRGETVWALPLKQARVLIGSLDVVIENISEIVVAVEDGEFESDS